MLRSLFRSCQSGIALRRAPSFGTRLALLFLLLALPASEARAQQESDGFQIQSVNLAGFQIVNDELTAVGEVTGTLAGVPFETPLNFALRRVLDDPNTRQLECSILNLELGPINLNLLGLHVDTSAICLEVTGTPGGGLLGDLLCGLAGGPGGGLGLPILPTTAQISALERELKAALNSALGQNMVRGQGDSVCTGDCPILNLVLGPLDLTLLGLNVRLDDCEGGPVQVCISATAGEGLLGDLLCGLSNLDIGNLTLADIARLVRRTQALLADGALSDLDIAELTRLLGRLIR